VCQKSYASSLVRDISPIERLVIGDYGGLQRDGNRLQKWKLYYGLCNKNVNDAQGFECSERRLLNMALYESKQE